MKTTFQSAIDNLKSHPAGYTVIVLVLVLASMVVPQLPESDRLWAFVVAALFVTVGVIYFHSSDARQNTDTFSSNNSEYDPDEELVRSLRKMLDDEDFVPHLIVGIARGGLIVAGYLAKQLTRKPNIPVISLWRKRDTGDYQNPFNCLSFNRSDVGLDSHEQFKILIVDAFCIHGNTLKLAKDFVARSAGSDNTIIKTATIFLRLDTGDRQIKPDFATKESKKPVYAFGEEE